VLDGGGLLGRVEVLLHRARWRPTEAVGGGWRRCSAGDRRWPGPVEAVASQQATEALIGDGRGSSVSFSSREAGLVQAPPAYALLPWRLSARCYVADCGPPPSQEPPGRTQPGLDGLSTPLCVRPSKHAAVDSDDLAEATALGGLAEAGGGATPPGARRLGAPRRPGARRRRRRSAGLDVSLGLLGGVLAAGGRSLEWRACYGSPATAEWVTVSSFLGGGASGLGGG